MRGNLEQLLKEAGFKIMRRRGIEGKPDFTIWKYNEEGKMRKITFSPDAVEEYMPIKTRKFKIAKERCEECGSRIERKVYITRDPTQSEKRREDNRFVSIMLDITREKEDSGIVIG